MSNWWLTFFVINAIGIFLMYLNYRKNPAKRNPLNDPLDGSRWAWFPVKTRDRGWKWLCWVKKNPNAIRGFFGR